MFLGNRRSLYVFLALVWLFGTFERSIILLLNFALDPVVHSVMSQNASSIPTRSHTFVEADHEIISTVILLLPLIQEWLLPVTSERMCTKSSLPGKSVVRLTDSLT